MKLFSSSCAVVALFASAASADVVITLTNFGAYGNQFAEAITPGRLSGTLVGATIDVDRTQSTWFTRANDLTLYVDAAPLGNNGLLQLGGSADYSAAQRYSWPNGGGIFSTTSTGRVNLATGINMDAHQDVSFWLGNGNSSAIAYGRWSGTITLHGVNLVVAPSPGAFALLAVAGITARRRRA